jgi:alkylation response protein AidB-like acyl-CoA dehydrogenase
MPLPGKGMTSERHRRLLQLGCEDLSLARIAEAHADALAILAEADMSPRAGALYAVWASDGPASRVVCERADGGHWLLSGIKQYCSGASLAQAALVTAHHADELLLFEVTLDAPGITAEPSQWKSSAFDDTSTLAIRWERVPALRQIGVPNWYLTRPGFWHGALGPAACWAGGAVSLVDAATRLKRSDPHSRAHVGALQSIAWGLHAVLEQSGREIDDDPVDVGRCARRRALKARHLIERACTEVLDRFGRATGPQLLAYDAHVVRQHASLALYIRQCHGERDLETIPEMS